MRQRKMIPLGHAILVFPHNKIFYGTRITICIERAGEYQGLVFGTP
jgi:hypothetical protein